MSALCQKRTLCAAANSRYSITSSARASSVPGMVRPNAFAVLRLTTRSNLVGCSTGMSAGFVPRRILSTNSELDLERRAHGLNLFEEPDENRYLGLHHEPDAFDIGRNLLKKLQPFSADRTVPVGKSCEVAIGTRFVVNVTGADRIAHAYENNRYGVDFRPNNARDEVGVGDQHVRCEPHQLPKVVAHPVSVRPWKAYIDADIAPFVPTQLLEFLPKRRYLGLSRQIGLGIPHQHADPAHAFALLCVC